MPHPRATKGTEQKPRSLFQKSVSLPFAVAIFFKSRKNLRKRDMNNAKPIEKITNLCYTTHQGKYFGEAWGDLPEQTKKEIDIYSALVVCIENFLKHILMCETKEDDIA